MATADEYAAWIVKNKDRKGTPEFETVAAAYKEAKAESGQQPEQPSTPIKSRKSFMERFEEGEKHRKELETERIRQLGLAARYGLEGVGSTLDFIATPFRMAQNAIMPPSLQAKGESGKTLSDMLGLPSPQTKTERIVGDISRGVAGMLGFGGVGSAIKATTGKAVESLAPTAQSLVAGGSAGLGSGIVREGGGTPAEQMIGGLAGGMLVPASIGTAKKIAEESRNVKNLIGASFGQQASIEKLASDAATRTAGDAAESILSAIKNRQSKVPGVDFTVGESIAQSHKGKPGLAGGATVRLEKDLSGAYRLEDIIPGASKTRNYMLAQEKKQIEADLGPIRQQQLSILKKGGVDPSGILTKIDNMMQDPKISSFAESLLPKIRSKISGAIGKFAPQGKINPEKLYTIRMELRNDIDRLSRESGTWDKKLTGKLERGIQLYIDDAMEQSGAQNWKSGYMQPYAARMKAIRDVQEATKEAKYISRNIKPQAPSALTAGDVPQVPTLLSRPMMAINFGLRIMTKDANTPVAREIAKRMLDPDEYAKLIKVDKSTPLGKKVQEVITAATLIGTSQTAATGDNQ